MNPNDKNAIRRILRQRRLELSIPERRIKSEDLKYRVMDSIEYQTSEAIAFYWPNDGEIDPMPLLEAAYLSGKQCFLPVLQNEKNLAFIEYQPEDALIPNRFGIMEPNASNERNESHKRQTLPPHLLDLVMVPLVAFDRFGQRLGRGAGYYDKTFAFTRNVDNKENLKKVNNKSEWNRPILLGLGYEFQQVEALPQESWDIVLYGVATDENFYRT